MRRLAMLVVVVAVQPLAVLLPTMADALSAKPHPVAPVVTRTALTGVDPSALRAERSAGQVLTFGAPGRTTGSRVGAAAETPRGLAVAVLTPRRTTPEFAVVGVTWTGPAPAGTSIEIRVRENGSWGAWAPAPVADDGPDLGTAEAAAATAAGGGTDPVLTSGRADGVQVKVLSATGTAPAGLALALVDPGTSAADGTVGTTATASAQAMGPRPTILPRAQWGADESLRRGAPTYNPRVVAGVLHHTAGANGYSAAAVPAQLRGIYAYHTKVRGWNDIAYNVLVDRFGRLWEGRAGGVAKSVRGAHALGFNAETFGVAAMGNYETAAPSPAMLTAIARVFAWKFSLNRIDPRGRATLVSEGNLRYPAGTRVRVTTMLAHRDVGPTACPGAKLYAKMGRLRAAVASRVGSEMLRPAVGPRTLVHGAVTPVSITARLIGIQTWKVEVTSACTATPVWTRTGTGSTLAVRWPGTTSRGAAVPPGSYVVTITAHSATSSSTPYGARLEILPAATSGTGSCPAYRLAARTAASVADGTRRSVGASSTLVVVPAGAGHRTESVFAGALAHRYGAGLMSSPAAALSAEVVARIQRDNVIRVVLVGRDGTWGAGVGGQITDLGATPVTIGGATSQDVLVAAGHRVADLLVAAGRPTTHAMLIDPADPVAAATAAGVAARLGRVVLPVGPAGVPAGTSAALSALGVTHGYLAGRGGIDAAAVTALRAVLSDVVDVRAASRDAALVNVSGLLPAPDRSTTVVVPGTATDGLEAVLASSMGRPAVLATNGDVDPLGDAWLTANGTAVRRLAIAAHPGQVSAAMLGGLNRYVRPVAAPAAVIPSSFALDGSGFGHGVGMSQYGAYSLARGGANAAKILGTYYPGTATTSVTDSRPLKVNLLHASARASFGVTKAPGVTGSVRLTLSAGASRASVVPGWKPLVVVPAAGGRIAVRRGSRTVFSTTGPVHVTWTGTPDLAGNAAVARLSGTGTEGTKTSRPYRYGEMWVVRYGSRLEVVNELPLGGGYLRGLAEMPTSWGVRGPAALQAQAVAARTYAWAKLLRGPIASCGGCTLYDSTRDQAFRGYEVELARYGSYWVNAIAATKGRILTYAGAPAQALYYSSSGGRTQDNRDVFGAPKPYLVSVVDPHSLAAGNPMASWRRTASQASMRTAFGLRDVVNVRVTTRTAGKAAKTVTATSSTGATATLTGAQLRTRLRLPSNWVWSVGTG